jgi:hypothetical protein
MNATTFKQALWSAGVLSLLGVVVSAPASAAVKFFYDRAIFETEIPNLPTEDFEAANIGPGQSATFSGVLDSFTDNQYFSPGSIRSGFGLVTAEVFLGGDGFRGNPTKDVSSSADEPFIELSFTRPVLAVGVDLRGFDGAPGRWLVDVEGGPLSSIPAQLGFTNAFSASTPCLFSTVPCGFIGILSTDPIRDIFLGKPAGGGVIDNLSFGNPVPEPSTLLFLGSGLLGLARLRRR